MTIQILGKGCPKCNLLEKHARLAIEETGAEAVVEKITDMETLMEMGMLVSPGLAIDGDLVQSGRVLSVEQVSRIIRERTQ